ncbi:hypothetical protein QU41_02365 [Bradyrhizobium elkanii]|nr:hypothetical protein QU41_02365 [Bradyrhizobium elkanii]
MLFKSFDDRFCQVHQFDNDGLKNLTFRNARKPGQDLSERPMIGGPIGGDTLLHTSRNHLGDVTPRQGDPLAKNGERMALGDGGFGRSGEFLGPGHNRFEIEAERLFNIAGRRLACVAFAVRTIAPENKTAIDEDRKMTAQSGGRHPVGAQHKKPI